RGPRRAFARARARADPRAHGAVVHPLRARVAGLRRAVVAARGPRCAHAAARAVVAKVRARRAARPGAAAVARLRYETGALLIARIAVRALGGDARVLADLGDRPLAGV